MTVAMTFNDPAGRLTAQALRRSAAFGAARRHTRLVHILRGVIPVAAVALVLALVVIPFLSPLGGKLANVSVSSVGISGGKVKMETPKLSGYRKDNRPYQVTAENAFQEIRNPTQVELQALTARIQMEREGWVTVNARTGLFDTQKEKLRLVDDVNIKTENGHAMQMRTADIDFKSGAVVSKEPVKVSLGDTTVDAATLDVKNNGELIVFEGRVRVFIPNAPKGTIAGPEREGSTPMLELLQANRDAPAGEAPANGAGNGKRQ
ncbi:LPS export ABC transporter periplasmic protein LptC [Bosea sp. BH3]|uniref:LPS export ABC transporter periplasmic protein LptC n=1 Tax=Bosea sp. BH3 TaxID=2871701 RepID=UPI0021CB4294|nr:LPS export ABC transporter periplasmic protein LptC [Bosea sp. BH3]MCU4179393.1 LPS export ABC transporter periplasmic protein LptC [Bosea sp. BH3]